MLQSQLYVSVASHRLIPYFVAGSQPSRLLSFRPYSKTGDFSSLRLTRPARVRLSRLLDIAHRHISSDCIYACNYDNSSSGSTFSRSYPHLSLVGKHGFSKILISNCRRILYLSGAPFRLFNLSTR